MLGSSLELHKRSRLEVRRTNGMIRLEASRTKMMTTSRRMLSSITSLPPGARIKGTTFGMRQR
jgi:hypothetical protein